MSFLEVILSDLQVYYITQAQIKYANKQYNTLSNTFEMTFHNETIVEPCLDPISTIPNQHLQFIPIQQIRDIEINSFVGSSKAVLSDFLVTRRLQFDRCDWDSDEHQRTRQWEKQTEQGLHQTGYSHP